MGQTDFLHNLGLLHINNIERPGISVRCIELFRFSAECKIKTACPSFLRFNENGLALNAVVLPVQERHFAAPFFVAYGYKLAFGVNRDVARLGTHLDLTDNCALFSVDHGNHIRITVRYIKEVSGHSGSQRKGEGEKDY